LRQAYDYWQDQPEWLSTEPKEQKQRKTMKKRTKATKRQSKNK